MKKNVLIIAVLCLLLPLAAAEERDTFGFETDLAAQSNSVFQSTLGGQFRIENHTAIAV